MTSMKAIGTHKIRLLHLTLTVLSDFENVTSRKSAKCQPSKVLYTSPCSCCVSN